MENKTKTKSAPLPGCPQWDCNNAKLRYLKVGETLQTQNGFVVANINGWCCPVCAGWY